MAPLKRSVKRYSLSKLQPVQMPGRIVFGLIGVIMAGCSILPKASPSQAEIGDSLWSSCVGKQQEIERLQKLLVEKEAQQQEIERLQKLVAEKEAQIRSQEARQQDQAKTLQETSSQAAHAQVKLRRLATRPAAASTIAEVEMVMENLKSSPATGSDQLLQAQAARLLNAAATSYAEDNYAAAMDYAAQAREFINMMTNSHGRKSAESRQVTVSLQVPIPLRAIANSNLRQKPGLNAAVLGVLKKESLMIADAYQGQWLLISADGRSGWVLNTLVEAHLGKQ
ncbi:SH3 domain-containing protein [Nitrosospira sp. Nsp1]|uniref:SH3 domain-containing protein n=1 Tax=Nitrosospira sp. Nsp1 TaxID=136547 RepID=UPI00088936E8|nr:SH3 domain-containing protein [Nitrosospira sp. Nsp1]SCX37260.1 SH3 domain-containing protein [Nitrosospira sp. Nsp1]